MALGLLGFLILIMRPLDWARILSQHSCFAKDVWYGTAKATIAHRLRVVLLSINDLIFLCTLCDTLLFIFFVGGLCAEDTEDREFYAQDIHDIVAARIAGPGSIKSDTVGMEAIVGLPGPESWEDVEYVNARLKGILWIEELLVLAAKKLWEEAAAKERVSEV